MILKFPHMVAKNLNKEDMQIPISLHGDPKLFVVAFQQWQQELVNSWILFCDSLVKKYPNFDFYELPTIRRMNPLYQRFIDGGMRAGIPSNESRERTITLYIDKEPFKESLDIVTEETIYLFLIDTVGEIIWREEGGLTDKKAGKLERAIEEYLEKNE
ncbi:hypothetical protein EU527_13285 [Candidatus Thorarchaeota archaeon]|nr:MAG: hypothetical protein EU527_13285 [Candidatus Thorarchaeota archaeon]